MELVEHYLEEIVKVHGIYVLRVPDDVTDEDKCRIWELWRLSGNLHDLYIMPNSFDIGFIQEYSFYMALMMVRGGQHVTRQKWIDEALVEVQTERRYLNQITRVSLTKDIAPYLKLDSNGLVVVHFPKTGEEIAPHIDEEWLDAEDYVLTERNR